MDSSLFTPSAIVTPAMPPALPSPSGRLPHPVDIGGTPVTPVGAAGLLAWMAATVAQGGRGRVSYANAHNVLLAAESPAYHAALSASEAVFCDGFGVWGASRWLGTPLPERITLPDWSDALFRLADAEGWSLFFLGGHDGVAAEAAARLQSRFPRLRIATHHGYFDVNGAENQRVLEAIQVAAPTLLLVGMGPPRQEIWMHENHLHHHAAITMAVGCLFDYMAGRMQRGPAWMTAAGGEWLWRLVHEPQRLWRRYVLGNPRFIWHILRGGRSAQNSL